MMKKANATDPKTITAITRQPQSPLLDSEDPSPSGTRAEGEALGVSPARSIGCPQWGQEAAVLATLPAQTGQFQSSTMARV